MIRHLWIYLSLALVVLLSWFLAESIAPEPEKVQPTKSHQPDYFSNGFTKISMDEEGLPRNRLVADSMIHYQDDDTTELKKPVFTKINEEAPPWVIHSEAGFVSSGGKTIFLDGTVLIERDAAPGYDPITINTEDLTVKPEIDYAETEQFAELISSRYRISGIGMSIYFGEHEQVELNSNVHGKFEEE